MKALLLSVLRVYPDLVSLTICCDPDASDTWMLTLVASPHYAGKLSFLSNSSSIDTTWFTVEIGVHYLSPRIDVNEFMPMN